MQIIKQVATAREVQPILKLAIAFPLKVTLSSLGIGTWVVPTHGNRGEVGINLEASSNKRRSIWGKNLYVTERSPHWSSKADVNLTTCKRDMENASVSEKDQRFSVRSQVSANQLRIGGRGTAANKREHNYKN